MRRRPWLRVLLPSVAVLAVLGAALAVGVARWLEGRPFAAAPDRVAPDRVAPDHGASAARPAARRPAPRRAPDGPPAAAGPAVVAPSAGAAPARGDTASGPRPGAPAHADLLIVGLDRRPGAGGGRADTLLLVFVDDAARRVGLVSVPRDLEVDVPGHGPARINATLRIARRLGVDGPALLARVVEDAVGSTVGHVVSLDLGAFEALVDAVGGVDLDVPCPIEDDFEDPRTPTGRRRLSVAAGPAHLDGVTAAMYVRSRHGRSDFSRARRQHAVLAALGRRARAPWNLLRLPALVDVARAAVETDMTRGELLAMAQRVMSVDPTRVHGLVFGAAETTPHRTPDGRSVLLPNRDGIRTAMATLDRRPPPGAPPPRTRCPPADVALRAPDRGTRRAGENPRTGADIGLPTP